MTAAPALPAAATAAALVIIVPFYILIFPMRQ
jgi:hypothetical protein